MVRIKGELKGGEVSWVRGPGCNQSQYQWGKESPCYRNHLLSGVSFLSNLLQVLALGSPGWTGHGMQVRATDQWCLLSNSGLLLQKEHWEGLGEATECNRGASRKSKEVMPYQSAEPTAPEQVRDGNSGSWSQGSSRRKEGGPAKPVKVN